MDSLENINILIEKLKDEVQQLKMEYVLAKVDASNMTGTTPLSKIAMHVRIRDSGFSIEWRKIVPTKKKNGTMKPLLIGINKGKSDGYDIRILSNESADWERDVTIEFEEKARRLRQMLREATSAKRSMRFAELRQKKIAEYLEKKGSMS
jgi:hypothetical protein